MPDTATQKPAAPQLPKKLPMQFRFTEIAEVKPHMRAAADGTMQVEPDAYDITLTTDTPIDQGYCIETLGHEPGECDLSFAKRGISFMLEHGNPDFMKPGYRDPDYHLGLVEELEVANGKLNGVARFAGDDALSEIALRVKRDWASGRPTRLFISGGYVIKARTVEDPTKPGGQIKVRITKWQIREASNIALPADPRAGKRSARVQLFAVQDEVTPQHRSQEATTMPETTVTTPPAPAAATPAVAVGDDARLKQRSEENAQIVSLCVAQNCAQRAAEFIQAGKTLTDVKNLLFDEMATRSQQGAVRGPSSESLDGLSKKDRARYSYRKAAVLALRSRGGLGSGEKTLEYEVHKQLLELRSHDAVQSQYGGILVPFDLRSETEIVEAWERKLEQRTMGTNVAGKGLEWVGQQNMPLVEILEAITVLPRMGANLNTGLTGNLSYPRETGQPTVSFLGENPASGVSQADGATGEILSGPKMMVGSVKMSRQWLFQTAGAGESRVRNALINGTARALDRNGLTGTGSGTVPLGLYNIPSMQSVGMSNVAPTYPLICQMFGKIADQNADSTRCGTITTASLAWLLKSKLLASNFQGFIWDGSVYDGLVAGYRAIGTTQASKTLGSGGDEHFFAVGNWAYCDVNLWGATEIVVDEVTSGDSAQVNIRSYGMGDVVFTHPEAFCIGTAAKLA